LRRENPAKIGGKAGTFVDNAGFCPLSNHAKRATEGSAPRLDSPLQENTMPDAKTAAKAKAPSKSEVIKSLVDATGLTKKDVVSVLTELENLISKNLGKKGPGVFTVPGLMQIKVIEKKATKAGRRVIAGVERDVAAKPARKAVKVRALKGLKEMI
jgi:nucleoid DNA-binding protein